MNYEALPGMEEALKLVQEKKMSKEKHIKAAKAGKRWQDSDGDGKWYEKGEDVKEAKKDDSYLETDMKKRQKNNEKAIKDMKKMGTSMKNPHFEETQMEGVRDLDPEKGTAERKARLEKKRGMKLDDHPQYKKEEKEGMHRDAKTGEVVKKAEIGKTYYPNMPKRKTSVAIRKEKEAMKKEEIEGVAEAKKECSKCEGKGCDHCDGKGIHEGMKTARKNVGASTCWKGYKAKGTKMKDGKEVPNCVPANEELETMEASLMESGLFSDDEVRFIIGEKFDELEELYKGKHGQSEKEYQDGRSDGGKMVSGDSKGSGASYSSRAVKNTGPNPAGGSKKPQGQGRMTKGARADLKLRKANMKAGK